MRSCREERMEGSRDYGDWFRKSGEYQFILRTKFSAIRRSVVPDCVDGKTCQSAIHKSYFVYPIEHPLHYPPMLFIAFSKIQAEGFWLL
jgi:hypothetical protein